MKLFKTIALTAALISSNIALAEVSVIVNLENSDDLKRSNIKRIFLQKQKTFSNGQEIETAVLNSGEPTTLDFNKKALKKSTSQMRAYFSKLVFTGSGTENKQYSTAQEIIDLVKGNPNAIGYIDSKDVTADVKVVQTF